jgi:hypothetical protein
MEEVDPPPLRQAPARPSVEAPYLHLPMIMDVADSDSDLELTEQYHDTQIPRVRVPASLWRHMRQLSDLLNTELQNANHETKLPKLAEIAAAASDLGLDLQQFLDHR